MIVIPIGKRQKLDLAEFGGVVIPTRFLYENKNPAILTLDPKGGAVTGRNLGLGTIEIFDQDTGVILEKTFMIVDRTQTRFAITPPLSNYGGVHGSIFRMVTDRTRMIPLHFFPKPGASSLETQIKVVVRYATSTGFSIDFKKINGTLLATQDFGAWPNSNIYTYNLLDGATDLGGLAIIFEEDALDLEDGESVEDLIGII